MSEVLSMEPIVLTRLEDLPCRGVFERIRVSQVRDLYGLLALEVKKPLLLAMVVGAFLF
jgi:hypothetical protein